MNLSFSPRTCSLLATLAAALSTLGGCISIDLQATSTTDRPARANSPGGSRFTNTHRTNYVEEFTLRADRRDKLRTKGLWVTRQEAEAMGVDTDQVQAGTADAASGEIVKTGEGEEEKYFLPPRPLKRQMRARRPGSGRWVSGSTRFDPDDE